MAPDNWKHRAANMRCCTCMSFVLKAACCRDSEDTAPETERAIGRCRHNAPTMKGWPVMFSDDWCGEHKLDENKI